MFNTLLSPSKRWPKLVFCAFHIRSLLSIFVIISPIARSENAESRFIDELKRFDARIEKLKVDYRKELAERIRNATRIELYIVKFDGLINNSLAVIMKDDAINVFPSETVTNVVKKKTIDKDTEKIEILSALASQLEKPQHSGGAFSHVPLHAVRVYDDKGLFFESTFSWKCLNFGIRYPRGTDWLDTSNEMERVFNRLLPVPTDELKRYKEKHEKQK
jgi:hypothetical protein